jgi:hypothetical protein
MGFEDNVRATLLYFDLFDHPLSRDELYTFFPERMESAQFDSLLSRITERTGSDRLLRGRQAIRVCDGFIHLRNDNEVVKVRKHRERKARRMLRATKIVGRFLGHFPFVRGVFLSGSLSKGVNDGTADIDLFIIVSEERLWICRSIITVFKKVFLFNGKKFLCPNYFVTDRHLEIPERNIFTATELITLRPLFNERKLIELLQANRWVLEFFPNFRIQHPAAIRRPSKIQQLLELPMSDGRISKWDNKLMHYYKGVWGRRYPAYSDSQRDFQFRTTPYASKVHPNDYQTKVLEAYENRLEEEKLKRLVEIDD